MSAEQSVRDGDLSGALHQLQSRPSAAQELRDEAFEQAAATAGSIDGQPFEWISDADPRLGPVSS